MKRRSLLGLLAGVPLIRPEALAVRPRKIGATLALSRAAAIALFKERVGFTTYLEPRIIRRHTSEGLIVEGKTEEIPIERHPNFEEALKNYVPEYNHPENTEHPKT